MPLFCIHWIWVANFSANLFDSCEHFTAAGKTFGVKVPLIRCLNRISTRRAYTGF